MPCNWRNRSATPSATPSLRRTAHPRAIAQPDPCAAFGPRFSPTGLIAGFATGLYVPELEGAKASQETIDPKLP